MEWSVRLGLKERAEQATERPPFVAVPHSAMG
jgi:hypothetical protein